MYFPNNINYLRKGKGLSQKELGDFIGKTKAAISSYENGESTPTFENLLKLSEIFSVSLDDLVFKDLKKEGVPTANEQQLSYGDEQRTERFVQLLEHRVDELEQAIKDRDPELAKKLGIK